MGNSLAQAGIASIGVVIRYFKIVDILINFMGKINVSRSARMENWVRRLRELEFPTINFIEISSPIKDGGREAADKRREEIERKRELEGREQGQSTQSSSIPENTQERQLGE